MRTKSILGDTVGLPTRKPFNFCEAICMSKNPIKYTLSDYSFYIPYGNRRHRMVRRAYKLAKRPFYTLNTATVLYRPEPVIGRMNIIE